MSNVVPLAADPPVKPDASADSIEALASKLASSVVAAILSAARVEFDGERTLTIRLGDGAPIAMTLPVPIYRGVWRQDETPYERGDCVTCSGSLWISQRDTASKPGDGPDSGWTLAVKSGRDGRSAYDLARKNGLANGNETAWLASLKATK